MIYKCLECGKELNEEDGEVFRHDRLLDNKGKAVVLCQEHYNEYENRDDHIIASVSRRKEGGVYDD